MKDSEARRTPKGMNGVDEAAQRKSKLIHETEGDLFLAYIVLVENGDYNAAIQHAYHAVEGLRALIRENGGTV